MPNCADTGINSNIRIQSLYIPCASLTGTGWPGSGTTTPEQLRDALIAAYGAKEQDFEVINAQLYLRLPCQREQYKPKLTYPSGEPGFDQRFAQPHFAVKAYVREVEVSVTAEEAYLFYLVDDLCISTLSAARNRKIPITIIDAVLPESADYRAALATNSNPYSLRTGAIKLTNPNGGSGGAGTKRAIAGGFSFVFEEAEPKLH